METHTYTAVQDQNKTFKLLRDGIDCFCPYTMPIPVPGNVGGMSIVRMPCNTGCPFAEIRKTNTELMGDVSEDERKEHEENYIAIYYCVSCSGNTKNFELKSLQELQPKQEGRTVDGTIFLPSRK